MRQNRFKPSSRQGGFTLLEMLAVIVLLEDVLDTSAASLLPDDPAAAAAPAAETQQIAEHHLDQVDGHGEAQPLGAVNDGTDFDVKKLAGI